MTEVKREFWINLESECDDGSFDCWPLKDEDLKSVESYPHLLRLVDHAAFSSLETKLSLYKKLRRYSIHHHECETNYGSAPCNCGLDELIKELES